MARFSTLLLAVFFTVFSTTFFYAQIVQSFCSGPTSLQNQYLEDAWYVGFNFQMKTDSIAMSKTLPINPDTKNMVLAALMGVYNANLPARDSVILMYNIHAHKQVDLRRFEIYLDTSFAWCRNLLAGEVKNTGNYYIDSLANLYDFSLDFASYFPEWVPNFDALARIKTGKYVNTDFMAEVMLTQMGVHFANPYTFGGDGNQIYFAREDSFSRLTFRRGWEDCPSGCLFQRDWVFKIYDDCRVEFSSSYGDDPASSPVSVPEFAEATKVYPNPASDRVFVKSQNLRGDVAEIQLTDLSGKICAEAEFDVFNSNLNGQIAVGHLPAGLYFLTLKNDNQSFTKKVIINK